jgi:hypothetical protein
MGILGKVRQDTRVGGTAARWAKRRLLLAVFVFVGSGILWACAAAPSGL